MEMRLRMIPPRSFFENLTRDKLRYLYRACRYSVQEIAELAGCSESTIYRKMRKYNIYLRKRRGKLCYDFHKVRSIGEGAI